MKSDDYRSALDAACREWESLARQRADIDARLTQLGETIGSLTRLCGLASTVPWGLTDACRVVLRNAGRPMTPVDVRNRLAAIGFDLSRYSNELASIHTVLKRLNQAHEVLFIPRSHGKHAYEWNRTEVVIHRFGAELKDR